METVLGKVIKTNTDSQTIDIQEFETGTIYKNIDLDKDVNFQQMPKETPAISNSPKGAIVMLAVDDNLTGSTIKVVKIWGTETHLRRDLEESEVQIQSGGTEGGSYLFLDKFGNVELSDGSFQHLIQILSEDNKVKINTDNFLIKNKNGISIEGKENGEFSITNKEGTRDTNITIKPSGEVIINTNNKASIKAQDDIILDSESEIKLGGDAQELLVLGNKLLELYNKHTHASAVGPTGIPMQLMNQKSHLSDNVSTE